MNTIPDQMIEMAGDRRRRRLHSDEFKADAVAACMQPGVSMAAVAMARGVNANLLRRWVNAAEMKRSGPGDLPAKSAVRAVPRAAFVAVAVPAPAPTQVTHAAVAAHGIRIELRRGEMSIDVTWPADAATDCATWMRELLR